ncbi:MAG: septum site-determining protein MinC [Anaerolineae bacterium]
MATSSSEQSVQIRGTSSGLVITLPNGDLVAVLAQLAERLQAMGSFVKGGRVAVEIGARALNEPDIADIGRLLEAHQVSLWALLSEHPPTRQLAANLGLAVDLAPPLRHNGNGQPAPAAGPPPGVEPVLHAGEDFSALLVHGTLRGGQSIEHPGAVIVMGDVNAGAQVVAGGDVVIWGRLRGTVHAGAAGNRAAVVCALVLQPTQLRIGDTIGRAPDPIGQRWRLHLRPSRPAPEVAHVSDGAIMVEPWDQVKSW